MRNRLLQGLALGLSTFVAAEPLHANRLTFEVWPDASPDHVVACSLSLTDGWLSLVQVRGAGLPGPQPMRWRASRDEVDALSDSLLALIGGELLATDPTGSREPPVPFLTVTWMTRLDGTLATGLYMQPGLDMPPPLSQTLASLGLDRPCGLNAKAAE